MYAIQCVFLWGRGWVSRLPNIRWEYMYTCIMSLIRKFSANQIWREPEQFTSHQWRRCMNIHDLLLITTIHRLPFITFISFILFSFIYIFSPFIFFIIISLNFFPQKTWNSSPKWKNYSPAPWPLLWLQWNWECTAASHDGVSPALHWLWVINLHHTSLRPTNVGLLQKLLCKNNTFMTAY